MLIALLYLREPPPYRQSACSEQGFSVGAGGQWG